MGRRLQHSPRSSRQAVQQWRPVQATTCACAAPRSMSSSGPRLPSSCMEPGCQIMLRAAATAMSTACEAMATTNYKRFVKDRLSKGCMHAPALPVLAAHSPWLHHHHHPQAPDEDAQDGRLCALLQARQAHHRQRRCPAAMPSNHNMLPCHACSCCAKSTTALDSSVTGHCRSGSCSWLSPARP